MTTPRDRAAQLWFQLSALIPFAEGDDCDWQALATACTALIAQALTPQIDKSEAFDNVLTALAIGDQADTIQAISIYREALLAWQRGLIDGKARDAEMAIRALRSYTR